MAFILASPPLSFSKARASVDPLTRAATAAEPHVQRWWRATWQAFQDALPERWAFSSLETVLRHAWQTYALPRFEDLHALLQHLAQGVTRSPLPILPPGTLGITQAVQAIETSLAQVPAMMARVPQALLPDVAVLTIPQQGALARMADGLAQETTLTPAHAERTLRTQARAQLDVRTRRLASEQAWTAAQAGQQAGRQQQAGTMESGIRRYWQVHHDERLCSRCASIPALNEGGVGLVDPFQSTDGPIMTPPRHIACRCNVELR